jgi:Flp pilus assembly protein TadG
MWNLEAMKMSPIKKISLRARGLVNDCRGIAAIEFAMIVPVMLVMFFGVVEFSSGVAVNRKVTQVARTLSDLVSQSTNVLDTDLTNAGQAAKAIMTPYPPAPLKSSITELYVDPATKVARVQWSRTLSIDSSGNVTFGTPAHQPSDVVTIPTDLQVGGTYVIWSEVSYVYVPTIGYVMAKAGVTLKDFTYTRPRLSACVTNNPTPPSACPPPL